MGAISTICFNLQGKRSVSVFGHEVETLDQLVNALAGHRPGEVAELLKDEHFIGWLNSLGYEKEMRIIRDLGGSSHE